MMRTVKKILNGIGCTAAGLLILFCYFILAGLLGRIFQDSTLATMLLDVITVFGCIFLLKFVKQNDAIYSRDDNYIAIAVIVFLLVWFSGQMLGNYIINLDGVETGWESYSDSMDVMSAIERIILLVIFAPVTEEFLFRGGIYQTMRRGLHPFFACLIVSVLFALCHRTLPHIPFCIVFSMFQCALVEKTNKLRLPILCHMVFNIMTLMPIFGTIVASVTNTIFIFIFFIFSAICCLAFYIYSLICSSEPFTRRLT